MRITLSTGGKYIQTKAVSKIWMPRDLDGPLLDGIREAGKSCCLLKQFRQSSTIKGIGAIFGRKSSIMLSMLRLK